MRAIAIVLICLACTAITLFTFSNPHIVNVKFWELYEINVQLYIVVLASMAAGVVLAFLVSVFEQYKLRFENRRLRKELTNLKDEVDSLRNMPLSDPGSTDN